MKLKKPPLKKPNLRRLSRKKGAPLENGLPRITNETVAAHREEVLSSARKYIYPLQHSKHRVVMVSVVLLVVAVLGFFAYCCTALYRFQSTSGFIYGVTQVIPFPVAKAGSRYVSYDSYLFELRRYMHYYKTQQEVDFSSKSGEQQLADFKRRALDKVIEVAYAKQLAKQYGVSVSNRDINNEIALVKAQNRLGSSQQVFEDVLSEYWGWTIQDFKRELRDEILEQKVAAKLDTAARHNADLAYQKLQSGESFATVAKEYSDDAQTAGKGGEYPVAIDKNNRDIAPQLVAQLFRLQPGQYSNVINTGYRLEIVKVLDNSNGKVRAAHISFTIKDISEFTKKQQQKHS
ncbi:MAG TPA: SurA N-terminal domain-containing protein, partial [Candidatus Saccharimonadales bacterium]|nr:SurA N-terminal domain-containing protein [Candidatus Saccharimonadales bacterium]